MPRCPRRGTDRLRSCTILTDAHEPQQLELLVTRRIMQFLPQPTRIHLGAVVQEVKIVGRHRQPLPPQLCAGACVPYPWRHRIVHDGRRLRAGQQRRKPGAFTKPQLRIPSQSGPRFVPPRTQGLRLRSLRVVCNQTGDFRPSGLLTPPDQEAKNCYAMRRRVGTTDLSTSSA